EGPAGFCNASRIAALRPGSGMDTSCAWVETMKPVRISVGMMPEMVLKFIVGGLSEASVPRNCMGLKAHYCSTSGSHFCAVKITEDVREYAASETSIIAGGLGLSESLP